MDNDKAMNLSRLGLRAGDGSDPLITGISVDSRQVRDGHLFAALPGSAAHGGEFIRYALRQGAGAILTDRQGAEIAAKALAGSDAALIVAAVNALRQRYDYVFTSGGIGPTHDDMTADAIAAAFDAGDRVAMARPGSFDSAAAIVASELGLPLTIKSRGADIHYWGGRPRLSGIRFLPFPDLGDRLHLRPGRDPACRSAGLHGGPVHRGRAAAGAERDAAGLASALRLPRDPEYLDGRVVASRAGRHVRLPDRGPGAVG